MDGALKTLLDMKPGLVNVIPPDDANDFWSVEIVDPFTLELRHAFACATQTDAIALSDYCRRAEGPQPKHGWERIVVLREHGAWVVEHWTASGRQKYSAENDIGSAMLTAQKWADEYRCPVLTAL